MQISGNALYSVHKKKLNLKTPKKINRFLSMSSEVPTDNCFADLLIGDSALLLYYSESRTRSRKLHYSTYQGFAPNICLCLTVYVQRF